MKLPAILPPPLGADDRWDLRDALAWQSVLGEQVRDYDDLGAVARIAGADVAYDLRDETLHAAVVVVDAARLEPVESVTVRARASFPYLSGLLSLREAPVLLDAFSRLLRRPDLVFLDGHGRAHPRRFGLACHVGLALDLPAIGVAKSLLVGTHGTVGPNLGSWAPLVHGGEIVGCALRTRRRVAPVYVSVGHRVCLETAIRWVLACGVGYRVPEPTRLAHLTASALRAGRRVA